MYRGNDASGAQSVPCEKCGRPRSLKVATCPHCAGGGLARIQLSETTAAKLAEERSGFGAPWPAWLRALIFVLAFPVTVPSLVVNWLMAKRWGRIPIFSMFVDGFIVLLLTLRYPLLLAWAAIACVASAVMLFRAAKQRRIESGIFFGHSNMVALPLIFGGSAVLAGILVGVPSATLRRATLASVEITSYRLSEVYEHSVPIPKHLRLRDASIDWEGRVGFRDGHAVPSAEIASASLVLAPVLPSDDVHGARGRSLENAPRVWFVARAEVPPSDRAEGLLWSASDTLSAELARVALTAPASDDRAGDAAGAEALLVLGDASLYDAFSVTQPAMPVGWGWIGIAAIGALLLGFATWRATEEDEDL